MFTPKISVITVVFNAKKALSQTMQSIRCQTYKNIEYIVIDGASKDGTVDVIKENLDMVSYWISEPDKGIYDAMNKGLAAATGDYVWFMNAGDLIAEPHTLENIFKNQTELYDIYYGETTIIDCDGNCLGMRRLKTPEKLSHKSFKWGMLVSHQSILIKRSITQPYDLQYSVSADFDWVLNCLKKTHKVKNTHLVLSAFENSGLSSTNFWKTNRSRFAVMRKHYGLIPTLFYNFLMLFRLAYTYLKLGRM